MADPSVMIIADQSKSCLAAFNRLCELLQPSCSLLGDELRLSSVNDELGRFKVWVGNIGALRKGPASLDSRLQAASHAREQVFKALVDLNISLDESISP